MRRFEHADMEPTYYLYKPKRLNVGTEKFTEIKVIRKI